MKRFLSVLMIFAGIIMFSNGQEKGKNAFEITFDPAALFDASAGPLFEMPYLKYRTFLQEDLAFRMGLGINFNSELSHPFNSNENIERNNAFSFRLSPGVEKHFGSGKFSPYLGTALTLGWKTSGGKYTVGNTRITTHNIWTDGSNPAYFELGLSGLAGCDYYVTDNFYLGFEFSPGFSYTRYLEQERNNSGTSVTTPPSSNVRFSLYSSSGLRAGVRF